MSRESSNCRLMRALPTWLVRRHLGDAGDRAEAALERRRHARRHRLGARARQLRAHRDGRIVDLRQRRHRQHEERADAGERDPDRQQHGADRSSDEGLREVHRARPVASAFVGATRTEGGGWPASRCHRAAPIRGLRRGSPPNTLRCAPATHHPRPGTERCARARSRLHARTGPGSGWWAPCGAQVSGRRVQGAALDRGTWSGSEGAGAGREFRSRSTQRPQRRAASREAGCSRCCPCAQRRPARRRLAEQRGADPSLRTRDRSPAS